MLSSLMQKRAQKGKENSKNDSEFTPIHDPTKSNSNSNSNRPVHIIKDHNHDDQKDSLQSDEIKNDPIPHQIRAQEENESHPEAMDEVSLSTHSSYQQVPVETVLVHNDEEGAVLSGGHDLCGDEVDPTVGSFQRDPKEDQGGCPEESAGALICSSKEVDDGVLSFHADGADVDGSVLDGFLDALDERETKPDPDPDFEPDLNMEEASASSEGSGISKGGRSDSGAGVMIDPSKRDKIIEEAQRVLAEVESRSAHVASRFHDAQDSVQDEDLNKTDLNPKLVQDEAQDLVQDEDSNKTYLHPKLVQDVAQDLVQDKGLNKTDLNPKLVQEVAQDLVHDDALKKSDVDPKLVQDEVSVLEDHSTCSAPEHSLNNAAFANIGSAMFKEQPEIQNSKSSASVGSVPSFHSDMIVPVEENRIIWNEPKIFKDMFSLATVSNLIGFGKIILGLFSLYGFKTLIFSTANEFHFDYAKDYGVCSEEAFHYAMYHMGTSPPAGEEVIGTASAHSFSMRTAIITLIFYHVTSHFVKNIQESSMKAAALSKKEMEKKAAKATPRNEPTRITRELSSLDRKQIFTSTFTTDVISPTGGVNSVKRSSRVKSSCSKIAESKIEEFEVEPIRVDLFASFANEEKEGKVIRSTRK